MSFVTVEQLVEILRAIADKLETDPLVEFNLGLSKKKHGTGLDLEIWWGRQETEEHATSLHVQGGRLVEC